MIVHEAFLAFCYTDEAANAFILCDPYYAVAGRIHRQRSAHFRAITALIAYLNFKIASVFHDLDGASRFINCFKICL